MNHSFGIWINHLQNGAKLLSTAERECSHSPSSAHVRNHYSQSFSLMYFPPFEEVKWNISLHDCYAPQKMIQVPSWSQWGQVGKQGVCFQRTDIHTVYLYSFQFFQLGRNMLKPASAPVLTLTQASVFQTIMVTQKPILSIPEVLTLSYQKQQISHNVTSASNF